MEQLTFDPKRTQMGRRIEMAMAESRDALYAAAPADLVQRLGIQRTRIHGAVLVAAKRISSIHSNHAVGFGVEIPATEPALNDVQSWFKHLNIQFGLSVSPLALPKELPDWLKARHFCINHQTAILYFADDQPRTVETPFTVQRIRVEQALIFAQTLVEAFDLPPLMVDWMAATVGREGWHHYLAWEGEQAAAAGILQVHDRVGHLGWAATYPDHRGRGAHSALVMQRVQDAKEFGCDLIVVDTNFDEADQNISLANVQRLGFRLLYTRPDYRSPDPQNVK